MSWGKNDNAANSPFEAVGGLKKKANTGNQTALYGNTTADAFITNETIGLYGVDTNEAQAARSGAGDKVAHAGWVLRKEGSGGRAGRVQYETLVTMASGSFTGDGTDDTVFEDAILTFTTQTANATGNAAASESVSFSIEASVVPSTATIIYSWEESTDEGNNYATINADAAAWSGETTQTLTGNSALIPDGTYIRPVISATGADDVTGTEVVYTTGAVVITINTQPVANSANSGADEQATFTVNATALPDTANLAYVWQQSDDDGNTDAWAAASGAGFTNDTTDTITVDANTVANVYLRVVVSDADGLVGTATSDSALFTNE